MNPTLPPVAPSVTAELVAALTPRLRKRLDAGVAKVAGRPRERDGDVVRIAVDDDTDLELHAPSGVVTSAEAIRCGCLLAPDCLHRAAAASAAPVADPEQPSPSTTSDRDPSPAPAPTPPPAQAQAQAPGKTPPQPSAQTPAPTPNTGPAPDMTPGGMTPGGTTAGPDQRAAALALHDAAAAVLEAGTDGAGAVLQAELLRAAHTARLAKLPRAASRAVAVVTALRAARDADPAHRLADLTAALRDVLLLAHRIPDATGPELAELCGTARQPYTPDGSLRLYGLFTEPVLTATGYAGAVTWTADATGRLYTVSDVAPGGAGRAGAAADRTVRVGDTSLTHRELSRAGLAVSGATVSATGRLGAGAGVRAVRASGADWHGYPLDRLWAVPPARQVSRALAGDRDLLFLDVTLLGTVREAAGECLVADCGGLTLRFTAAHDDPALPHRENLRLLASAPGARLRVVARLTPAPLPRAQLLAVSHPTDRATRLDLGVDRLRRADLPAASATALPPASQAGPTVDEAPVHLLRRRVHQAVSGGRRVLALPGDRGPDAARLRGHGLVTAGELLIELHAAAADRERDPFGRLLPSDSGRFARAWLAATVLTEELDRILCAAAWGADPADPADPAGPADPTDPTDPTDSADPTQAARPTGPAPPTSPTDSPPPHPGPLVSGAKIHGSLPDPPAEPRERPR
ncbi:SWIM zinc finger family protein [Streptomyces enissocaesilis]|uniref:SWIM zinc finger family protein n=1 Tax=Streptomyces TaxID=1883 RepID=UPI000A37BE82|nr:SWIM zinc finger family protein [Streptomyces rochei]WDI17120.1 SWIM zinc finger family protein [Streptomyces enissocaesilis]